ncbi:TIGR02265 family protein [Hyalangium minutum]|nr:TIGR02265 family protein [Hyalangium minutum]
MTPSFSHEPAGSSPPAIAHDVAAQMEMPLNALLDLKKRLALATPTDTVRGLFFSGVLDTVRYLATEREERHCSKLLGQAPYFDFLPYAIPDFLRLVYMGAQCLSTRDEDFSGALRKLGKRGMKDFLGSSAGKTFLSFSFSEPRRVLSSLPVLFRTTTSYGERTVQWLGPRHCRLVMKRDFMPAAYHEGALLCLMETLRLEGVEVRSRVTGTLDSEYELTWTGPAST